MAYPEQPDEQITESKLTVDEQVTRDYNLLAQVLPAGDSDLHLALARLAQLAVTEHERANVSEAQAQELHDRAFVSSISGLLNRNALLAKASASENAAKLRERKVRQGSRIVSRAGAIAGWGILYIDLDGFKAVNDTFSHNQGDRILRYAGRALQLSVRERDELYHLSGDEFITYMPMAEPEPVNALAARTREDFRAHLERQANNDSLALPPGMEVTTIDEISLPLIDATFGAHWSEGPHIDRMGMLTAAEADMRARKKGNRNR